ncbi:MAG: c-type cytochrome biogenesis protein CcmI [Chromatiaceae bacterium]|nr:c-type cytochrome biogenesis protein CcmI [Chromatiaceae bacterium]
MIIFWILASGLVALALLFVVVPLLRAQEERAPVEQDALNLEVFRQRLGELDADLAGGFLDQDQYAAARRDLERDLLHDIDGSETRREYAGSALGRWTLAAVLAALVPLLSVQLYLQLGEQSAILPPTAARPAQASSTEELPPMEVLVERLEERLRQNPEDIEGWLMIGRTYFALEQPLKGQEALHKAHRLDPERLDAMLAYAEAQLATGQRATDSAEQPQALIEQALKQDATNPNARWLNGLLAYRQGDFGTAASAWQGILDELDPNAPEAAELRGMVADARQRLDMPASASTEAAAPPASSSAAPPTTHQSGTVVAEAPENAAATPPETAIAAASGLDVLVQLDPALAEEIQPGDSLFVFARAAAGPPMPLAVVRLTASELPARVRLDDSLAMNPGLSLSAFPEVMLIARVSKSGQTAAQPGDLEGQIGPLPSSTQEPITLTIDQRLP